MSRVGRWFWPFVLAVPLAVLAAWAIWDNAKLFFITLLNGLTLASLYFIVASGTSDTHVRATAQHVIAALQRDGTTLQSVEGFDGGRWVLLDRPRIPGPTRGERQRRPPSGAAFVVPSEPTALRP